MKIDNVKMCSLGYLAGRTLDGVVLTLVGVDYDDKKEPKFLYIRVGTGSYTSLVKVYVPRNLELDVDELQKDGKERQIQFYSGNRRVNSRRYYRAVMVKRKERVLEALKEKMAQKKSTTRN